MNEKNKTYALLAVVIGLFIGSFFLAPWPQDPAYHNFADNRGLLGIHNCNDVLSNIPFLFVGLFGVYYILKYNILAARASWLVFFIGVILVAPGSAYYHYIPTSARLVWDRLPITVGFMGLFVAIISTFISQKLEKYLLPIAIIAGFSSVIYWSHYDDLRFYAYIQIMPLVTIPLILFMFKSKDIKKPFLVFGILFYVLAKLAESNDVKIFLLTSKILSGHTMKHLFAAMAPLAIAYMFRFIAEEKVKDI